MVGRVWPRHGHCGRPLNSVVRRHAASAMSWDIFVQDLPPDAGSVDDIPKDFRPKPLGPRSEIIAKIREVVPNADFSDPSWGDIEGPDWSIEVNLGTSEVCDDFALHVRGHEGAVPVVLNILNRLGLRALDPSSDSGLFDPARALESFGAWRRYADGIGKRDG